MIKNIDNNKRVLSLHFKKLVACIICLSLSEIQETYLTCLSCRSRQSFSMDVIEKIGKRLDKMMLNQNNVGPVYFFMKFLPER